MLTTGCRVGAKHAVARCNDDVNVVFVNHLVETRRDCFGMGKGLVTGLDRVRKVKSLL